MDELRKNEFYEAEIGGFTSEGAGVCRIGGRAVFVPKTLPGERWRIRIVKVNRSVVWGRGEELLVPSPHRVQPVCPLAGRCGGCALQHMDYETELAFKLKKVNDALRRIGNLPIRAEVIHGADTQESYRNKAIYNFAPGPVCGFYRARSHEVLQTSRCILQPASFDRAAQALKNWMIENDIPAYDEASHKGTVRHFFLRSGTDGLLACIVSAEDIPDDAAQALTKACPELTGVLLCRNDRPGNTVLTGDIRVLWGESTVRQRLCGAGFEISVPTFFQVNTAQAETLYRIAERFADPAGKTVVDLYCGAGTIGQSIARDALRLIGNDIVPSAVENARRNAVINGMENTEYLCMDASEAAAKFAASGIRPDVVITDPPRRGMDETVIGAIAEMLPERIVYVSCDPATLARDLKRLTAFGYTAEHCEAVDMFPRTCHVETVCLLSREDG